MAPPSIFTRPRRQIQAAQSTAFDEFRVASEDEWHAAIASISARAGSGILAALGGAICFVAPFTVSAPLIIPGECPGLTVRALSKFPITAATAAVSTMFDVRAELVTIRDIFCHGATGGYFTTFVTNSGNATSGRSAHTCRVLDCDVIADRIYVDAAAGDAHRAKVRGVVQLSAANGTHDAPIVFDSGYCTADGCDIDDGGGDAVTIEANGHSCHIVACNFDGADGTSTASQGNNTWIGNTEVGALNLEAGAGIEDEEAANTP